MIQAWTPSLLPTCVGIECQVEPVYMERVGRLYIFLCQHHYEQRLLQRRRNEAAEAHRRTLPTTPHPTKAQTRKQLTENLLAELGLD